MNLYLVLEFQEGGTLKERILDKTLNQEDDVKIVMA